MVQDQLVDYIHSQTKLGVSRDAIKTALVGVGWSAQDVEDTFKRVESTGAAAPAAAATPAVAVSVKPMGGSASAANPVASNAPQSIRVSDLVSASLTPTSLSSSAARPGGAAVAGSTSMNAAARAGAPASGVMQSKMAVASVGMAAGSKKNMSKSAYIMIGVILILAGVSAYLYFQNTTLSSQVQTATGQSQGSVSQINNLNGQVQALTASTTALTAQITNLNSQIVALQTDLSFLMVPVGQSATTPVNVTVTGMLSGSKSSFVLTTPEGVKISIKNSASADAQAALAPLLSAVSASGASSTPVQLSGMHTPGVASMTVVEVNGEPIARPSPNQASAAASSTAPVVSTTTGPGTPQ